MNKSLKEIQENTNEQFKEMSKNYSNPEDRQHQWRKPKQGTMEMRNMEFKQELQRPTSPTEYKKE